MWYRLGQVLVFTLATAQVLAQRQDSVRVVFRPVLVEDTLATRLVAATPQLTLDRRALERVPVLTVADALQGMPGVFVRNYGGLGGLKTVSIRGATAAQTAVVLEGIRLNSVANGLVDLGQIPLELLEHVTVERGSNSARWGANAVGGALVMRLRLPQEGISGTAAVGAFSERDVTVSAAQRVAAHTISGLLDVQYSRGDYPFTVQQFGETVRLRRTNGDALLVNGAATWGWASDGISARGAFLVRTSRRGAPGAVLQGVIENAAARLNETEMMVIGTLERGEEQFQRWRVHLAGRSFTQHYRDSLARFRGPGGADDRFTAYDGAIVLGMPRMMLGRLFIAPAAELYINTLRGNLYRSGAGSSAERIQLGGALGAGTTFAWDTVSVLAVDAAVRADVYSDVPDALSGSLHARWIHAAWPIALRLGVGTSYRPPSFNELYYQNFGSTDLRPERGVTLSSGIVANVGALRVEMDAFFGWVRDQIIAVPRSAITWSVQNAGRVWSRGVELLARYDDRQWKLTVSGTFQRVTYDDQAAFTYGKQVVYTPSLVGMLHVERMLGERSAVLMQVTYLGTRYSQTDNAPASALNAVGVVDGAIRAVVIEQPLPIELRGEVQNLFDAQYAIIRNFPMPGRSWRLRMVVRWN
jgi:outer membrane cobalamin receptor